MTAVTDATRDVAWHSLTTEDVTDRLHVSSEQGLTADEAARRLQEYGPNELPTEPPPTLWQVAKGQLANPMNIMLLIVAWPASPSARSPRASWSCPLSRSTSSWVPTRSEKRRQASRRWRNSKSHTPGYAGMAVSSSSRRPNWCRATSCCWKPATSYRRTDAS